MSPLPKATAAPTLLADEHLGGLDDHGDAVAGFEAEPLERAIGDRCYHVARLDLDLDLGHDGARLYANDFTLELIACAEFHFHASCCSYRVDPHIGRLER